MRERTNVPLSKQAFALLRQLRALTGTGQYLFPSLRDPTRPMSYNGRDLRAPLARLQWRENDGARISRDGMETTRASRRGGRLENNCG